CSPTAAPSSQSRRRQASCTSSRHLIHSAMTVQRRNAVCNNLPAMKTSLSIPMSKQRPSLLAFAIVIGLARPATPFTAYVSNEKGNTISVVDTDKMETVRTIKVGQRPRGIELTKDDSHCLVAVGDDDAVQVVDTKTGEVIANLPSGPDPELFIQSPDGRVLYVANENNNTVTIIDMERRATRAAGPVGGGPQGSGARTPREVLGAQPRTSTNAPVR